MTRRVLPLFVFMFFISIGAYPHGGEHHKIDIMTVFGFDINTSDKPDHKNEKVKEWCDYISWNLIDDVSFHNHLYDKYGISFRGARLHRYLFHWGYDAIPWSSAIESKIVEQSHKTKYSSEFLIQHIKSDLIAEQKRRNRCLNAKTEKLFEFAHGGEDAKYARFFAAVAYNTHILGDYESSNTIFDGLCSLNNLIGMFVIEIRNLDNKNSKDIIAGITKINNTIKNDQKKADKLMAYLKISMPEFISKAKNGSIKRRLEKRGFKFIN